MTGVPTWPALRQHTAARIGLARTGASLGTAPLLAVRLAHAQARDAVHAALDIPALEASLPRPVLRASSQAPDRRAYLMRPDLGRALDAASEAGLTPHHGAFDLAIVVADGLSAQAARHAPPLLALLLPLLADWSRAPVVLAQGARVALGDRIAAALGAGAVLMLLGERPGLSAPDSLGAYLTWRPGPGTTDAERNCVSNIRPAGLPFGQAARRIAHLLHGMRALGRSGVTLKDDSASALADPALRRVDQDGAVLHDGGPDP